MPLRKDKPESPGLPASRTGRTSGRRAVPGSKVAIQALSKSDGRKPTNRRGATMFIKNCWYVAAWSSEVESGKVFGRTLLDIPVVLWRDTEGNGVAMNDRGSHRGAPLATVRLEG